MTNKNTGTGKIEILFFSDIQRLEYAVSDFFQLGNLNEIQKRLLHDFVNWLLQSLIFDTKAQSWKYKSFEKGKTGSLTFPMYQKEEDGLSSFAHMLYGGDPKIPWVHFDFDVFDTGCNEFIQKMGIEFDNTLFQQAQKHFKDAVIKVREAFFSGEFEKIEIISQESKSIMKYRSRSFEFLASLGLDYGADSEGVCEIPMKYTLI